MRYRTDTETVSSVIDDSTAECGSLISFAEISWTPCIYVLNQGTNGK